VASTPPITTTTTTKTVMIGERMADFLD